MKKHLMQIDFPENLKLHERILKISAQALDMAEEAVVQTCIQTAREAGIKTLLLLDKQFVLDAIREKMEREGPDVCERLTR